VLRASAATGEGPVTQTLLRQRSVLNGGRGARPRPQRTLHGRGPGPASEPPRGTWSASPSPGMRDVSRARRRETFKGPARGVRRGGKGAGSLAGPLRPCPSGPALAVAGHRFRRVNPGYRPPTSPALNAIKPRHRLRTSREETERQETDFLKCGPAQPTSHPKSSMTSPLALAWSSEIKPSTGHTNRTQSVPLHDSLRRIITSSFWKMHHSQLFQRQQKTSLAGYAINVRANDVCI
jgi:hypothetical protein